MPRLGSKRPPTPWRSAALVLLFNLALLTWLLLKPAGHSVYLAVDNVAQFAGPLAVLPLCFRDALRRPRRWSPLMLGPGILGIAIGQMIFTYYEQVLHYLSAPFPSWADASWLISYPFLLLGILLLPARRLSIAARTRVVLDGVMILTAIIAFSWYFVLGPTLLQGADSLFAQVVSAAYPCCDLMLVACLLLLATRVKGAGMRRVVLLLQAGLSIVVVSDTTLAYEQLHNAYHTGSLLDLGWPLGYMLVGLAAGCLRRASGASREPAPPQSAAPAPLWRVLLPYTFLPAVGLLSLYAWQARGGAALDLGVYLGGLALVVVVVLRQVLALLENQRLYRQAAVYAQRMEKLNAALQAAQEDLKANNEDLHAAQSELIANNDELRRMHVALEAKNQALLEANTRLEALATTDALTGLLNHRAIVAALDHELERGRRYGHPCSVLFLDLDHFKALNDSYGHAAGDATLRELAQVLDQALREGDRPGRWGGEEFVVLLPETDAAAALVVGERVRAAVAAFAFSSGAHLTTSLGVASYPDAAVDRDALVELADRALYAAKRLGRNQVRAWNDAAVTASSREDAAQSGTADALARLVAARDRYRGQHAEEVAALAQRLALLLGLDAAATPADEPQQRAS